MSQYLSRDTICALATPPGGALAIVRMSGPGTSTILGGISSRTTWTPRQITRIQLRDKVGKVIDDAMAVLFVAPASYSGEDLAELYLHGSPAVARLVLERLRELGARLALPGEFSFRAVRNGKLTLVQAEAVADLIASQNQEAVSLALEKLEGTQAGLVSALAEELKTLVTLTEAGIDFADQDLEEVGLPALKARLKPILQTLSRLEGSFERGQRIQNGVLVALLGRPNAGKSSLFNSLLGEERSIVSEYAGTTRDVVRETITLRVGERSATLRFADTAGVRATDDAVEKIGVGLSLKEANDADIIVCVVDATQAQSVGASGLACDVSSVSQKVIWVYSQVDRIPDLQRNTLASQKSPNSRDWILTSAKTGEGVQELAECLVDTCERWLHREPKEVLLTRASHQDAVKSAMESLTRAAASQAVDLMASDLRQALRHLGPVMGETPVDEILGRIFSQFCIGK